MSLTNQYHKLILNEAKLLNDLEILLNFSRKQNTPIFMDTYLNIKMSLEDIYKQKDVLETQFSTAEAINKSYAITIGCNNNDMEELHARFSRFTSSSYCKGCHITYNYEVAQYLHVHMLVQLQTSTNNLKRQAEIRTRYGKQLDGTKSNFDIRYLKGKLDTQKWLAYIKKLDTKDFSQISNKNNISLSGFIDTTQEL